MELIFPATKDLQPGLEKVQEFLHQVQSFFLSQFFRINFAGLVVSMSVVSLNPLLVDENPESLFTRRNYIYITSQVLSTYIYY